MKSCVYGGSTKVRGFAVKGNAIGIAASFVQSLAHFIIFAVAIFMKVRSIHNLRNKEEEKPAESPKPEKKTVLLREIHDRLER